MAEARRSWIGQAGSAARTGGSRARRLVASMARRWRQSLQVRVVGSTLAFSCVVVALLGWFLIARIEDGLLAEKVKAATEEAWSGTVYTQTQLSSLGTNDTQALESLQAGLISELATRSAAGRYAVVILASAQDVPAGMHPGRATGGVDPASIPPELRVAVGDAKSLAQRWTYTEVHYNDERHSVPGVVVGSRVGPWQLYYLFPLDQEQETLALVQRTVVLVGAILVVLLCAIAYLVTRQVVTPVRMAARIAQRYEVGRLRERMYVRGEDDLAQLASSFNSMAESLERQIAKLEELSRVQRRFVSDVSHELRTPLTTVRMAADMLYENRPDLDPASARAAELLQTQLDRFEALLTDLLEISRYDAGAASLDLHSCDMRELVRAVVETHEPLVERSGSRLILEQPHEPCPAEVERRRVERILRNLLGNAIEHGEGRDIEVRMAADEQAVAVIVRDHGIGLTEDQAARVFDRFWRADPSRVRGTGGTGLGLSIALEDAHLHGGWLEAWGAVGGGAVFRLTLPRTAGAELTTSPLTPEVATSAMAAQEMPLEETRGQVTSV
ncbi:MAG: MtrAB system histidine kinase MtrB [Streptosporangiales bacterium]